MTGRSGASTTERVLAGRYRLGARRGAGLDIAIFEAFDEELRRIVAVRLLHPDICATPGFPEQFRATMQRVSSIRHPNLASVLDWGPAEWNGLPVQFVVTENLTGGSLRDLLDRGRHLTPSQALVVGLDVCRALDTAHRHDLVHGDVRPASIVFGTDQRLRLVDLGLAQLTAHTIWHDAASLSLERARYASPERAQREPIDGKSDVYSLALTMIESVSGHVPFTGDSTVSTLSNRVGKLMPVTADLGPLAAVLERAGRPETDTRYTAAEFGRALVQTAEKLPRPAPLPLLVSTPLFDEAPPEDPTTPLAPPDVNTWAPAPVPAADDVALAAATAPMPTADVVASIPTAVSPVVPPPPQPEVHPPLLREKRSRRKLLAVVAVVVVAAALGGLVAWYLNRDQSNEVPDLVGMDAAEALNAVSEFDWDVEQVAEASDDVDEDVVIRTEPGAGVRLDPGDPFTIVVSGGPAPRVLPEITGMTVEQATAALDALGLVFQEGERAFDETAAPGTVISWVVPDQPGLAAGGTALPETVIVGTVSAGPEPRVVPDLTGVAIADATAQLEALGLVVVVLPEEFHPTVAVGGVARQIPPPGSAVMRDTTVEIAPSKGPEMLPLPALAELTVDQVRTALEGAGFVLGEVKGDPAGVAVLAELEGAPLASGALVPRGSAIDVTFEVPPPPTTLPPETTTTTAPPTTVAPETTAAPA